MGDGTDHSFEGSCGPRQDRGSDDFGHWAEQSGASVGLRSVPGQGRKCLARPDQEQPGQRAHGVDSFWRRFLKRR